ncbi:Hypothetical protein PBC10988_2460 [Planctomycetales bacterium 10988]|nr:Hypothetical protein PBC10988_2460 [Planctomycetales bacterium 10988]
MSQFKLYSHMANAINNGHDLHSMVAAQVTGKAVSEVSKEDRQRAKAINFGKPGGMGDKALQRYAKESYGVDLDEAETRELSETWTKLFPETEEFLKRYECYNTGYKVALFLNLADSPRTDTRIDQPSGTSGIGTALSFKDLSILGWMCLKTLAVSEPVSAEGYRYSQHDINFFWSAVQRCVDHFPTDLQPFIRDRTATPRLSNWIRKEVDKFPVFTLTGRLRASANYTARHNTIFQGLAADGAKLALWKLLRHGFKVVNFIHDEFLIEVPESSNLKQQAEKIKQLMIEGMREVILDLPIEVEYAAMRRWYKDAEAVYDEQGRLVPWEPSEVINLK